MVPRAIRTAIRALAADRASRLVALTGFSLVACLGLLGTYLCLDLRDGAWRTAERDSDNLLALIEEGVGRSLRTYDLALREAARLAARPEIAALDLEIRRMALFDTSTQASGLAMIALTDAAGRIRIISDPAKRVLPDLSGLPEFALHRADPRSGLVVTGPTRSLVSGHPILRMTRRIETPDGSFAGIVSGAVYLDYFQSLFERLRIEDGSTVNLFLRDGTLLVRAPFNAADVGRSIAAGASYRHYRAHRRGHFLGQAQLDGKQRFYAFANLDDLPLIVTVAVGTDSIRAAWIGRAGIVAALILCLCALTFGLTVLLQREIARRAAREASARAANAALSLLARTDDLTGLPNRRRYDEALAAAWDQAARSGTPLSLLVVDADRFKRFNDRFGHHRGDEVLRAVAGCLRRILEPEGGVCCRIGGEEFAAILPGRDAAAARAAAERVRRAVVNLQIGHAPDVGGVATVSIGLACAVPGPEGDPDALFAAADAALYAAKAAGRNRVRAAPEPSPAARPPALGARA